MSPTASLILHQIERAYGKRAKRRGVVDLSRTSTLSEIERAMYADIDRYDERVEQSETVSNWLAQTGQLANA